jgi:hypothetical protein
MSELPVWMTEGRDAWVAEFRSWITDAVGAPTAVTCVRERIWGAVHRVELADRVLFFKAPGPGGRHEPVILADIAPRWPGLVPDVVAVDLDRVWLLMEDHGAPMWESCDAAEQVAIFERILPHYAQMQRGSRAFLDRWIDAGTPDRRVTRLPELLDRLLSGELWSDPLPLTHQERGVIDGARDAFARACAELGATPFADAIDHSDLHGGNVLVGRGEPRLVDWGDSTITHPFASPFVIYQHAVAKLPASERRAAALRHRDAYLEAWSDDASPSELRRAFMHAIWIAYVVRALNFAHHLDDTGPDAANWSRGIAEFLRRWQRKAAMLDRPDDLIEAVASEVEG